MGYKVASKQPPKRDPKLHYDDVAPGLYDDDEVLVELGTLTATVSYTTEWLENGAGVSIKGVARWCKADGTTILTEDGQHVESYAQYTVNPVLVRDHGVEALAKEVLLALMGEPPQLKVEQGPIVAFSEEARLNMSIRNAADTVQKTKSARAPRAILS
jgi:hypothetical protein